MWTKPYFQDFNASKKINNFDNFHNYYYYVEKIIISPSR